jgi:hypothetical protein
MFYSVSPHRRARGDLPLVRQKGEALSLGLGFALSSALIVAWLGLRLPVLATAMVPPLASASFWQRRRARPGANSLFLANSPAGASSLLDPGGLQNRLQQFCKNGAVSAMWRRRWEGLTRQMEVIRSLAARCVELEPQAAVPLLVCMEELLDRIEPVGRMMQQLDLHAPSPLSGSYGLVSGQMEALQNHLGSYIKRLQEVHDSALEHSMLHPGEPIDFQQLLTKSS